MQARVALITCATEENARLIADSVVTEKLAACVNIVPGLISVFSWEGEIKHEKEWLLIVKTAKEQVPALESRVHELHSYSTPEFVVLKPKGISERYEEWLTAAVA